MAPKLNFEQARDLMLAHSRPAGALRLSLGQAYGRILAEDLAAAQNQPPFDTSPYDGYAFRSADSQGAAPDRPVTLKIIEEVAAGSQPRKILKPGEAVKILTGAPLPPGADAVIKYESTRFTAESVTIFTPAAPGQDVIWAGDDFKAGEGLTSRGARVDPALAGLLASQGYSQISVYKKPVAAIISTGSELADLEENKDGRLPGGAFIFNSNRYLLESALFEAGLDSRYLGRAGDTAEDIAALMRQGLAECDVIIATGGVSVGDYDLTPAAMKEAGAEVLVRHAAFKPGGACAYGLAAGKPVFCLSGNPSSALINFYAVVRPCLKKMTGNPDYLPHKITAAFKDGLPKASPQTRLMAGHLTIENGGAVFSTRAGSGKKALKPLLGTNALGVITAGTQPVEPGTPIWVILLD